MEGVLAGDDAVVSALRDERSYAVVGHVSAVAKVHAPVALSAGERREAREEIAAGRPRVREEHHYLVLSSACLAHDEIILNGRSRRKIGQ